MKLLWGALPALMIAGAAIAAEGPRDIELGQTVDGRVGKGRADCYQIDAPKGATLSVGVRPKGFAPSVQILRGARCDADVPQFETEGTADAGADLPFKSVGGRYLVVVRAKAGEGAYQLKVEAPQQTAEAKPKGDAAPAAQGGAAPVNDELAAAITAGLSKEEADKLIGGVAAPEEPKVDPKVALMRKQLAVYKDEQEKERLRREEEARRAAEEAEQRRIEEEERREQQRIARQEEEANRQQMWGTILQGVQMVANSYVQAKQERYEAQSRLNELARQRDAANAAKAAEQQRQAREAQQRQQEQVKANAAQQMAAAYQQRNAMIARTSDPNVKRQLEAQNQQMLAIAKANGITVPGASQGGGSGGLTVTANNQQQLNPAQQAQQRAQAEAEQRKKEQAEAEEAGRKRQEAIAKANADREKMLADQRKAQEAARKAQEEAQRKMQAQMLLNQHASGGMSTVGLGAVPKGATPPGSGELSQGVGNVGQCKASNVSVRYNLGVLMGEATVNGVWRWEGEAGCTPPHNTAVWLRLQNGSAYGFVKIAPPVPEAGKGTFNVAESPSWSQLVCAFSGSGPRGCMSEAQAKALWANGQVTGFVIAW